MFFSVISINFNNLAGIKKTFSSLFNQSFKDYEIIIIDGGSNDGSKEFIDTYSERFSYWISENDNGVYHAMNKGLSKAKGEYCIFLNSGDYFFDKFVLEKCFVSIICDTDLVYGLIQWENTLNLWNPKRDLKPFEMFNRSCIPHQAVFFKTETIKKYGGYKEEFRVISDWGLMLEMIRDKYTIQKIDLIVSICETQGISAVYEQLAKKERIQYLLKYSFSTLIIGYLFLLRQYSKRK